MIRLNVIELKENESIDFIKNPEGTALQLADFYREKMTEATETKTDIVNFECIKFVDKNSENFQNIYILERCIMDYLREKEYPKKVQIVCDKHEVAELYKVVYNFYYPGSKSERLDDECWD